MTLRFTPRTGAVVMHGSDPEATLRLLRCLELGSDLDLDIVIAVPEGHRDVPALADGLGGRGTLRSIDPALSVSAGANLTIAELVDKGILFAWILGSGLRPQPAALSILTRHMASVPDCAVVCPRFRQRSARQSRTGDVEAVPFFGSLYRALAIGAVGPFGDADIVDGYDRGWSDRARLAGWRVMMNGRAQLRVGEVDG